ncbi:serine hydrolase [Arthrobacter sp.]|uniref:serine hydrolase n=1 Tax=Arthrobacter sp. TaxID=1667 RepID=UPI002810A4D8|nr:serine hydrolase [Arthrobacter sp.]
MARGWLARASAAASAVTLALALSGCTAAQPGSTPTGTAGGTVTPPPTSSAPALEAACVADPASVIDRVLPSAASGAMPAGTAAALDKAAQDGLSNASSPGAIVAVRSPEGTWIKALGLADKATDTPMTPDMYLRIGSVTKTFTGTLVLQLAQEGRLSVEDPIGKYLPDIPRGNDVTIRMLLNMTSGIASYSIDPTFQQEIFSNPSKQWNPDDLIAKGLALPRPFEPGAKFDYSNTNTLILGRLIEKVTGTTYADALQTHIFDPLSLSGTSMPGSDGALPVPHPTGLTLQGLPDGQTTPQDATAWNPSWGWTAGALSSTAADMLTYGRALGTGQGLLDPETQALRFASIPGPAGYGLAVGCIDGWFGHSGEIPGFNTALYYDTRSDTTVAILANSDILSGNCTQSPTLPGNPTQLPCIDPAGRILIAVSAALGRAFMPNTKS